MSMINPLMNGGMSFPAGGGAMGWPQMQQAAPFGGQQGMFPQPPLNPDPNFLIAHQHAMAIAKQAYQLAVAQQAMAAAGDEWERGSSVSAFGGMGMSPMGGMPGMMPGGYGMGWNNPIHEYAIQLFKSSLYG